MSTLLSHIALVSDTRALSPSDLSLTSAAIQKQVMRDLARHWDVQATVDVFDSLEEVPPGYWPIVIVEEDPRLARSPIEGFHLCQDQAPIAIVKLTDQWQLVASHEVLEMLVDPYGHRTQAADSPQQGQGRVDFLVEVCDPSQGISSADGRTFTVNGIPVADFYTPHYFDPVQAPGVAYSCYGSITKPLEVLPGGYLSWKDGSGEWWQQVVVGNTSNFKSLGSLTEIGVELRSRFGSRAKMLVSLRSQIDQLSQAISRKATKARAKDLRKAARSFAHQIARPSRERARKLRAHIEKLRGVEPKQQSSKRSPRPAR